MIRERGWAVTIVLAAVLAGAPLPFGSVVPWAAVVVQVAAFAALAAAVWAVAHRSELGATAAPAAAVAGIAAIGALQALPWPPALVTWLSPEHLTLGRAVLAVEGVSPAATPLTLAPAASRAAALPWAAAGSLLLAAGAVGAQRTQRRLLLFVFLGAALFEVFFGARLWLAGAREIWGVAVPSDATRLRGTFVNPNHLATYLLMALSVAFALCWWGLRRARREERLELRLLLAAGPPVLWLTLFLGLAFTGSRAGLIAAVGGVVVQGVLVAVAAGRPLAAALGGGMAAIGLGAVAFVGFWEGFGRFLTHSPLDLSLGVRGEVYGAALTLWRRFPWTGTGLGTFRQAFPLVQPGHVEATWWHVESDPLELLVTTGVVGAALAALGLMALVGRLRRVMHAGVRSEDRAAALAALGALAAVLVQELFDFGLTMPANAATMAILCGAAAGAAIRELGPAPEPR